MQPPASNVARQPILDVEQQVFGYELLFRDGVENLFQSPDLEAAARSMLDSTLRLGFDVLCDGQRAIINWTHDRPLKDGITLLPRAASERRMLTRRCSASQERSVGHAEVRGGSDTSVQN